MNSNTIKKFIPLFFASILFLPLAKEKTGITIKNLYAQNKIKLTKPNKKIKLTKPNKSKREQEDVDDEIKLQTDDLNSNLKDNKRVETKNKEKEVDIKVKKKRKIRISRIQSLQAYHKKRKGKDIFGLKIVGFSGNFFMGSIQNAVNAGVASDDFSGFGAGALFDVQLAFGKKKSNGLKYSGPWYFRWGLRAQLDYLNRTDNKSDTILRTVNELVSTFIVKYYFPLDDIKQTRKIIILNRFHFFLGMGLGFSIGINDTIEDLTTRTFQKGPTQTDSFFVMQLGWSFRVTKTTYWVFDYQFGLNLSSTIEDSITGQPIEGTGSGGHLMGFHTGLAYSY